MLPEYYIKKYGITEEQYWRASGLRIEHMFDDKPLTIDEAIKIVIETE